MIRSRSRHSRRTLPTQRSAWARAFGARIGALITRMPSSAEDLVELTRELGVAITDQEARPYRFVVELHHQVACLLAHPAAVRVGRDPSQVHAATLQLDEEQNVEPFQEERVDGEEVALEDARRLLAKKLRPARLETLRRRLDARLFENRPDGGRRQLDPKSDKFALDPTVAPSRILLSHPHDKLTHLNRRRGPTCPTMRIRPAARDEVAVPTQQRRRRYERRRLPRLPRQHPAERSQQRTVSLRHVWTRDLALKHH